MEDGSGGGQVDGNNPPRYVCMLIGLSIPKGAHQVHAVRFKFFSSPCQYCIIVEVNNAEDIDLGKLQAQEMRIILDDRQDPVTSMCDEIHILKEILRALLLDVSFCSPC